MEDKPSYPRLYHPDQRRVSSIMNNDPHPPAGVTASFSPYWNQAPLQQNLRYGQPPVDQLQFPRLSIAERFMAAGESDAHTIPTMSNCTKKLAHSDKANDMAHDDRRPHHHQLLPFGPEETYQDRSVSTAPRVQNVENKSTNGRRSPAPNRPTRHARRYPEETPRPLHHYSKPSTPLKTTATMTTVSDESIHLEKSVPVWQATPPSKEKTPSEEGFWYCHRGCLLLCLFFFILILGFLLFLVWPRVPLLRIEGTSIVTPVEIVQTQQGWMQNVMFTTTWLVNVTVDNRQNYIPTRLNKVQVIVKDAVTNALVGKGSHYDGGDAATDLVLMDGISMVSLLVTVNYQARDMSDATFLDLVHACHRNVNDLPSSLPLHFWITLYMFGFDWLGFTPTIIATPASSGFFCPV